MLMGEVIKFMETSKYNGFRELHPRVPNLQTGPCSSKKMAPRLRFDKAKYKYGALTLALGAEEVIGAGRVL
jgi:hypothetical protein